MKLDLPTPAHPLKIGTRGSPLALAQAHEVRHRLMAAFELPDEAFEVLVISTMGDRVQDRPLKELGGKGLFTREIENDLLYKTIDIAVHSMKDMPVLQPEGSVDRLLSVARGRTRCFCLLHQSGDRGAERRRRGRHIQSAAACATADIAAPIWQWWSFAATFRPG